ncbi:MAG: gluconolaconase, partial [Pontibacter sp.]|nr:gluconolaconase [Pontibacter sp.]
MNRYIRTVVCTLLLLYSLSSCNSSLFTPRAPLELTEVWATDNTLRTPESALYDPQRNRIYVSNINQDTRNSKDGDGFISTLSPNGEILELYWVSGLNNPHGLALYNNVLYVADIDEVVAIATQSGAVLARYKADNARMLNDVAIDASGIVYVTDTEQNRIYLLQNGRISTWIEDTKANRPNGLLIDGIRMIVAFSGSGEVTLVDLETKNMLPWLVGIEAADGIA